MLTTLDAFDRTYQRTYNSAVTDYTYQGTGELPVKTQIGAGTPTSYALTPGGSPLGEKTGANTDFSLRDPHGDVVGLVTTAAANQGTTSFDAWGKPLGTSGTQGWFGYQGDPTDTITKQVDMGTRWYAPGIGRFSSRDVVFGDPLSPMTLNQHVYGGMNPITMTDPTGMRPICEGCSWRQLRRLTLAYSALASGTASTWSEAWASVPPPPPPEPAPPIVYVTGSYTAAREGGEFGVRDSCLATGCLTAVEEELTPEGEEFCRLLGGDNCPSTDDEPPSCRPGLNPYDFSCGNNLTDYLGLVQFTAGGFLSGYLGKKCFEAGYYKCSLAAGATSVGLFLGAGCLANQQFHWTPVPDHGYDNISTCEYQGDYDDNRS